MDYRYFTPTAHGLMQAGMLLSARDSSGELILKGQEDAFCALLSASCRKPISPQRFGYIKRSPSLFAE